MEEVYELQLKLSTKWSFTADQWKNWVFYFSVVSLRDILPSEKLECWRHFVLACRIFSSKTIIHEHFAGASFEVFNANRYGIKSCKVKHDPYFLHDLLMLQKVTSEIENCNDDQVLSCDCDYDKICERINTL